MLLPYTGEKTIISNFILQHVPPNVKTYVEPFGGMFAIYFALNQIPRKVIYNDTNYLNYNLFYWLSNKYKTFHKKIKDINASEYLFYEYKSDIYKIVNKKKDFDLAIKYAYVLSNCNSPLNVRNSTFNISDFFDKFKDKIYSDDFIKKIKKIKPMCLDYRDVINKYDNGDTFFYLDPPQNFEHKELSQRLKTIKGKFLLSCSDFPELKEYYPEEKFDLVYNRKEILIKKV